MSSILDHPSLPSRPKPTKPRRPFSKPGKELICKAPRRDSKIPEGYQKKWKAGNEERMLASLGRFGHLQLRVKFELLEENGDGFPFYKTISGSTLVFKRIGTQGCLLAIVDRLTDVGIQEAKDWTGKRRKGEGEDVTHEPSEV